MDHGDCRSSTGGFDSERRGAGAVLQGQNHLADHRLQCVGRLRHLWPAAGAPSRRTSRRSSQYRCAEHAGRGRHPRRQPISTTSSPRTAPSSAFSTRRCSSTSCSGVSGLRADVAKFNWIGRMIGNSAVLFAWHTAEVKKIQDAFTHELIVARQRLVVAAQLDGAQPAHRHQAQAADRLRRPRHRQDRDGARRGRSAEPALAGAAQREPRLAQGQKKINLLLQTGHREERRPARSAAHGRPRQERGGPPGARNLRRALAGRTLLRRRRPDCRRSASTNCARPSPPW